MADLDKIKEFINNKKTKTPYDAALDAISKGITIATPSKGSVIPSHLLENPFLAPAEALPDVVVNEVCDSFHPERGNLVVEDDGTCTVYLAEGMHVKEVRQKHLHQFIAQGHKKLPAATVVVFDINPMEQRTCKWFTAGEVYVSEFGAEVSEHYEFDRPHPTPVCSNPAMIKMARIPNPPCSFDQIQAQCELYEPEPDKLVRSIRMDILDAPATEAIKVVVDITTTRYGYGMRRYSVTCRPDTEGSEVIHSFVLTSADHKDNLDEALSSSLADFMKEKEAFNMEEIEIPFEVAEKNRYFDYVLEG